MATLEKEKPDFVVNKFDPVIPSPNIPSIAGWISE